MSFIQSETHIGYAPGYFLASADCKRETVQIEQNHSQVVTVNGKKYVPAGAVVPSNDANAKGILYEDVDVTTGAMPGSLVTEGVVYEDRLPAAIESAAEAVLPGIKVIVSTPKPVRPSSFNGDSLASITVTSTEGSGSGKTDIAVSGYTLKSGEKYVYKIAASAAPSVNYGEVLEVGENKWTVGTFPLDELTATDGHKITVAAVDSIGAAVAAGNATIDSKA